MPTLDKRFWTGATTGFGLAIFVLALAVGGPCALISDQRLATLEAAERLVATTETQLTTRSDDLRDCRSRNVSLDTDLAECRTELAAASTDPSADAEVVGDRNQVMQGSPGGQQIQVDVDRRRSLGSGAHDKIASELQRLPPRDSGVMAPSDVEAQRLKLQIISALKAGGWSETYRVGVTIAPPHIGVSVGSNSVLPAEHRNALAPLFEAIGQEPSFETRTGRPEAGDNFVSVRIGIKP